MKKYSVLLVDDDKLIFETFSLIFRNKFLGIEIDVNWVDSGEKAIREVSLSPEKYAVILVDHDLVTKRTGLSEAAKNSALTGIETIEQIRKRTPYENILMQSGDRSRELVRQAMRAGAKRFLDKPLNAEKVVEAIQPFLMHFDEHIRKYEKSEKINEKNYNFIQSMHSEMVGHSDELYQVCERIKELGDQESESRVLIYGENGTGKELVAQALHQNSPRKNGPFVAVNVAAYSKELISSELFGHVKGAFTGAIKDKKGRFLQANKGTLFLDEIGELDISVQVKLLRVLQENVIELVGGDAQIPIDVRIIAATNINLEKAISKGEFREDLYHRLRVIPINVPALRDRPSDIPLLIEHGKKKFWKDHKEIKASVFEKLLQHEWSGNVRELLNFMERTATTSSNVITEEHLDPSLVRASKMGFSDEGNAEFNSLEDIDLHAQMLKKKFLKKNLPKYSSLRSAAAGMSMNVTTLHRAIKNFGLQASKLFSHESSQKTG